MKLGNTDPAFRTVRKLTGKFQPARAAINDTDGTKLTSPEDVADRWEGTTKSYIMMWKRRMHS